MAKYKSSGKWRDVETNEVYEKDAVVDLTVKRAEEASKKLKKHGISLERIDVEKDKPVKEKKAKR